MLTVLLYVVVMVVVGAVLFAAASAVFGRGEALAPIPPGATATVLPADNVTGVDVRDLRFQQVVRGYKASEVDWALDRLAREIDGLRVRLAEYESDPESPAGDVEVVEPVSGGQVGDRQAGWDAKHVDADAETEAIATDAVAARAVAARGEKPDFGSDDAR
ncbi:MAG: DivIVA domain-containing protein [Rhodococcus sp. (in: high G+C Gram-positive bacteria)]|uniref:DivIVA domain-containing protein n=1 Tax=Rhodococcus sp. TaxID=1831 RepID=UPI003BB4E118